MSPGFLKQEALKLGAKVGIEFEMIVPNVNTGDDGGDMEADYSDDPRPDTIEEICDFFYNGDHNGRRDIQRLRETLEEDYRDWFEEKALDKWNEVAEDEVEREITDNVFDFDEAMESYLVDDRGVDPAVAQGIVASGGKIEKLKRDDSQGDLFGDQLEDMMELYKEAVAAANTVLAHTISDSIKFQDSVYERVRDSWIDAYRDDEWEDMQDQWLRHAGYHRMSNIEGVSEITWPYWTEGGDAGESIGNAADSFSAAVGRPVNWSESYHSARRTPNGYAVEPDGSIDTDDSGEGGLEFISPPLPLADMLGDMSKIRKWADRYGCYTNDSTGLHMNISLQTYDRDSLDYVKLAILLGDQHVLEQFGREGNIYCKSAFQKVVKAGQRDNNKVLAVFDLLKNKLNGIASRMIHNTYTDKYTSINVKDTHVEFRGPGGNYLDDDVWSLIEPTLCRFIVALDAAVHVDKYRSEYLKKLYKALAPDGDDDVVRLFVRYQGGKGMPQAAFKSFLKQRELERGMERGTAQPGQQYWWDVGVNGIALKVQVVAKDEAEAKQRALDSVPEWRQQGRDPAEMVATIAGKYDDKGRSHPQAQQYAPDSQTTPQTYRVTYLPDNQVVHRFETVGDTREAVRIGRRWIEAHASPGERNDYMVGRDDSDQQQQSQSGETGRSENTALRYKLWPAGNWSQAVEVYADTREQAIRVARLQHPNIFGDLPEANIRLLRLDTP